MEITLQVKNDSLRTYNLVNVFNIVLFQNLASSQPRLRHHKHVPNVPNITLTYKTLVLEPNFTLGNQMAFHHITKTVDCTKLNYSGFMLSASIITPHKTLRLAQTMFISN